jgi:hypothetical protein
LSPCAVSDARTLHPGVALRRLQLMDFKHPLCNLGYQVASSGVSGFRLRWVCSLQNIGMQQNPTHRNDEPIRASLDHPRGFLSRWFCSTWCRWNLLFPHGDDERTGQNEQPWPHPHLLDILPKNWKVLLSGSQHIGKGIPAIQHPRGSLGREKPRSRCHHAVDLGMERDLPHSLPQHRTLQTKESLRLLYVYV